MLPRLNLKLAFPFLLLAGSVSLSTQAFAQAGPCDILIEGVGLATPKAEAIAAWQAKGLVEMEWAVSPRQKAKEMLYLASPKVPTGKHGHASAKRFVGRNGDTVIEFAASYLSQGSPEDWKAWPTAPLIQSRIDAFCSGKTRSDSDVTCELGTRGLAVSIHISPPLDAPRPFCSYELSAHPLRSRPGDLTSMHEKFRLRVSPMTPKERQMLKAQKKSARRSDAGDRRAVKRKSSPRLSI